MKTIRFLILLFAALISLQLHAKIIEVGNFRDVLPHIDDKTLLILDLDNTIMEPDDYLGSDQWFTALMGHFIQKEEMSQGEALSIVLPKYNEAHRTATVHAVEESEEGAKGTVAIIKYLQTRNIPIIGLTARGGDCMGYALRQLESIGVNLSLTSLHRDRMFKDKFDADAPAVYMSGILFCDGPQNKHKILARYLSNVRSANPDFKMPSKIVFVDDKLKNVTDVERAVADMDMGIEPIGIRYGYLDKKVNDFKLTKDMIAPFKIETAAAAATS